MSYIALLLIVVSSFIHATWNYLAKRSNSGFVFVWMYMGMSMIFFFPFALTVFMKEATSIGWIGIGFIVISSFFHLAYSLALQKGYMIGDLSLVYPIARGLGPLLVAIMAVWIYGETLTMFAIVGIALIAGSVFALVGGPNAIKKSSSLTPVLYGVFIGIMIASYTLVDKGGVSVALLPPILLTYGGICGQFVMLTPFILRNWKAVKKEWTLNKRNAIGVGVLNPLAYILVLTAMTLAPVSHVAPIREMSILIGTVIGTYVLNEAMGIRRMIAASTMILGIIVVALSGG